MLHRTHLLMWFCYCSISFRTFYFTVPFASKRSIKNMIDNMLVFFSRSSKNFVQCFSRYSIKLLKLNVFCDFCPFQGGIVLSHMLHGVRYTHILFVAHPYKKMCFLSVMLGVISIILVGIIPNLKDVLYCITVLYVCYRRNDFQ